MWTRKCGRAASGKCLPGRIPFAGVVAAALATAFAAMVGAAGAAGAAEVAAADVALVPLDSRPANTYFPKMVAAMGGVDVRLPAGDELDYFTHPADAAAIGEWLLRQDVDAYVVSVSMLAYGGLIASRTGEMPPDEARAHVEVLRELKQAHPDRPIYAYDMIQRLAVTVTGDGAGAYYSLVQRWAVLEDLVSNLGRTAYADELEGVERRIPTAVLEDYKQARRRNHAINMYVIDLVAEGVIDYLVFGQDDAAPYGLHRAEREALEAKVEALGLSDRVTFFAGADEVDMVLLARYMTDATGIHPEFTVEYPAASAGDWVAHLEDLTIQENVRRHIEAAGGRLVDGGEVGEPRRAGAADPPPDAPRAAGGLVVGGSEIEAGRPIDQPIALMVNTPSSRDEAFVRRIRERLDRGVPVAVADVAVTNRVDSTFFRLLESEVKFPELLAFSGWNTAGNTLGIVIGQSVARTVGLATLEGAPALRATRAWIDFLLARVVTDDAFKVRVRPAAIRTVRGHGLNPDHLEETELIDDYVRRQMIRQAADVFDDHFKRTEIPLGDGRNGSLWKLIEVKSGLVWPRLFEIQVEPAIGVMPVPNW